MRLAALAALALVGCSESLESPPPSVDSAEPALVCNDQLTTPVTISGKNLTPLPVDLLDPDDRWVRIYIREDRIGRIRLGDRAQITSDTYPDRPIAGEVVFIGSEAEFTPRNVQTAEERVKLVYPVKVRITGDPGLAARTCPRKQALRVTLTRSRRFWLLHAGMTSR